MLSFVVVSCYVFSVLYVVLYVSRFLAYEESVMDLWKYFFLMIRILFSFISPFLWLVELIKIVKKMILM